MLIFPAMPAGTPVNAHERGGGVLTEAADPFASSVSTPSKKLPGGKNRGLLHRCMAVDAPEAFGQSTQHNIILYPGFTRPREPVEINRTCGNGPDDKGHGVRTGTRQAKCAEIWKSTRSTANPSKNIILY